MGGIREARYIQVIWQDQTSAKKLVESRDCLRLEPVDGTTVGVDVVSYSQLDSGQAGQFAIRLDSDAADVPRVELGDGTWMDLRPVTNPATGVRWWVEGRTWDDRGRRWLSDIYRGAGTVRIQAAAWTCLVRVSASTFTHAELERYLRDFQTGFWELILDDTSYLGAAARRDRQTLLDGTTLRAIGRFTECIDVILRSPKAELREVQRPKPRREVRPVARTFMEMAARGSGAMLTSRAYEESLDVPENRYAHHALRRVYQITKALCTVCDSQVRLLDRKLEGDRQRLVDLAAPTPIRREAVLHDVENMQHAVTEPGGMDDRAERPAGGPGRPARCPRPAGTRRGLCGQAARTSAGQHGQAGRTDRGEAFFCAGPVRRIPALVYLPGRLFDGWGRRFRRGARSGMRVRDHGRYRLQENFPGRARQASLRSAFGVGVQTRPLGQV